MARATSFILSAIPSLARIVKEHSDTNLAKIERLKKLLDGKEVALIQQAKKVNQWVRKAIDVEKKLQIANELLFQKDVELRGGNEEEGTWEEVLSLGEESEDTV